MKTLTIEGQKYLSPSWEEMSDVCFTLAKKIADANVKYDRLVAISKGGLTEAKTLLDFLEIKDLSVFEMKFYSDIYKTFDTPQITQVLGTKITGEKILLFDDVADSGKTLIAAKKYLEEQMAKEVEVAVLFNKPWTKFTPDFYGEETDTWIVFPHDRREMAKLLRNKWAKSGQTQKDIFTNLINLGYPEYQVEYFLKDNETE
ncbi:MAG: Purine phosphoribosyltransferase [Candidatus Gottesmanbacteria bacterium GW2011_GWA2_41_12]|uniref:Purine phosphoribosyltransferase n=2 Tax=Candidatus Gottesmaniibacteriota TaxID=1752720 RepID=A0A0G0WVK0_9BACT|nr:MAG: Purine phosphoribosyltransferase [Candidatus Gottesmanbacteria bacterium GW2011_GWC2_39_8]KKR88450.1 MAG: Purine phosphoribosyltransferase [Candidatus Gottesmanbacteria bacterium GW2011_GWA2_41_12]